MKTNVVVLAIALLIPQIVQAQGTLYVSNLGQTSAGSLAVGSDSWWAAYFISGTNAGGYSLDSIQLGMADASATPIGFTALIYSARSSGAPGSSLGTLSGSLNPMASGIYSYTPSSGLTLLPNKQYYVVVTAASMVATGAYDWSRAGSSVYNASGGWGSHGGLMHSVDGLNWSGSGGIYNPQFAVYATAVPEPRVFVLSVVGSLVFLWHRRKSKAV